MTNNYRYPGTRSFTKEDAHIFFGREADEQALIRLIKLEQIVVLYGKSGLGKTSLLNAGVLPQLVATATEAETSIFEDAEDTTDETPQYETAEVRFFAYNEADYQAPLQSFQNETVGENPIIHPILEKVGIESNSLWYAFKSRQLSAPNNSTLILVFDQFEELFTYPPEQIEAFKRELSNLLNANMPAAVKQQLRQKQRENPQFLSAEEKGLLYQPLSIKVVVGIRSDRLSLLDKLTDYLPNMLVHLYELKPLQREQAKAAIIQPAAQKGDFDTPHFSYTPTALTAILAHLADEKDEIEPFQIQYICEHAESVVNSKNLTQVDKADLGKLSDLFRNYYNNKINELGSTANQEKARRLIEDQLIFNGIRLSVLEAQITSEQGYKIPPPLLQKLANVRLLRPEMRNDQIYYEITHDTLVEPILGERAIRVAKERRKRSILLGIGLLLATGGLLLMFNYWWKAEQNIVKLKEQQAILEQSQIENIKQALKIKATNDSLKIVNQKFLDGKNALEIAKDSIVNVSIEALKQQSFAEGNLAKFRKIFAVYLMSKAKKELEKDNVRLALRLGQEALKLGGKNEEIRQFRENIMEYASFIFRNSYDHRYSSDDKFLTFFTNINDNNRTGTLNILNLNTFNKDTLNNCHYENQFSYGFSSIDKFLTFFTNVNNDNTRTGTLNILNLENFKKDTFDNCYVGHSSRYLNLSFNYSSDDKFLTFFTNINGNNRTGTLNILNLDTFGKDTFNNCDYLSCSYSSNNKFLTFFTDTFFTKALNILNLESFKRYTFNDNYSRYNYSYSPDSKFFIFFNNVNDDTRRGTLNILNLKNSTKNSFDDIHSNSYRYSSDGRFLTFFTDASYYDQTGILNILNLENFKILTFNNCYRHNYKYSSDNRFFTFFDNINKYTEIGTLNILNLENSTKKSFNDIYISPNSYSFSPDNKLFTLINNENKYSKLGTLNIHNLENFRKDTFNNFYISSNDYSYSSDGKFFTFATKTNADAQTEVLNILNLKNFKKDTFNNYYSELYFDRINYGYSADNKFLTIILSKRTEIIVLNLETFKSMKINGFDYKISKKEDLLAILSHDNKEITLYQLPFFHEIRTVKHQHKIESFEFSDDSHYLTSFATYPGSIDNGTLKITNTAIPTSQLYEYYDSIYPPLTPTELKRYGLDN